MVGSKLIDCEMNVREVGIRRTIEICVEKRCISEAEGSRLETVVSLDNGVDGPY